MPAEFPPIPVYELADAVAPGVNPAPGKVDHVRRVVRELEPRIIVRGQQCDPQAACRSWLVALGRQQTKAACSRTSAVTVRCESTDALRWKVEPEQRAIERDFAAMVAELVANRVLLRDEAIRARPGIRVDLIDERRDLSRGLPSAATLLSRPSTPPTSAR